MNANSQHHARLGRTALLVGFAIATLAGCAEAHSASPFDGGTSVDGGARVDGGTVIATCTQEPDPAVGAACSFSWRCPVVFTDFVDGMCGDEGFECVDGRIAEYEDLWTCLNPMDESPCSDPYVQPAAFSLVAPGSGEDPLGVTRACTTFNGWGDCYGGTIGLELLDADGVALANIELTFEDDGDTPLPRTCVFHRAGDPGTTVPCAFSGEFLSGGGACGGTSSHPRLCGDLEVELDGDVFQVPIALDAWVGLICF